MDIFDYFVIGREKW